MKIESLDHIAIRVTDLETSVTWYEKTLGLEVFRDPEHWGDFPVMVQAGNTGVALFPVKTNDDLAYVTKRMHIAFRVDNASFQEFQTSFKTKRIEYSFEDHHHFHSIYIKDPDGYIIELTTQVVN